ncbi:pyruvate kinase [Dunaliella salina]|uniref:Pyruvate kinase n=1 Tax=Dunaliella salina TaxID=3046 RepID=A0ABQ7GPC3_DUNSA|nr:pyruvate kinase [Dunaliella salina]|eukprot:KAF5836459.1 pyruvate kinase [Dunaliella salina]
MSGLGSSIYCNLPSKITDVLKVDPVDGVVCSRLACTIGPQTQDVQVLSQMLEAGMKIARFDFTYGDMAFHLKSLQNLKKAMVNSNKLCAVMLQPHGPEIEVLNRPSGPIHLKQGQKVVLTNDRSKQASSELLPITWPSSFMGNGLQPGSLVFVGQYLFTGAETTSAYLTVYQVEDNSITCTVNNTCSLEGATLIVKLAAGARNPSPCLTDQDVSTLAAWARENPSGAADFIALPRTRCAADVQSLRDLINRLGLYSKVVAKLEDIEGLVNHTEILDAADAVVFSRGSLGTCMAVEKVFLAQKMLLRAANAVGKPCFVTRVVDTLTAFYRSLMDSQGYFTLAPEMDRMEALASAAVRAAHKVNAKLIIAFTVTGRTARLLAKYKPQQPILAAVCADPKSALYSNKPRTSMDRTASSKNANNPELLMQPSMLKGGLGSPAKSCLLYRNCLPVMVNATSGSIEGDVLDAMLDYAKSRNLVQPGDRVVVSQCPRDINSPVMSEAGVVQLLTVDHPLDAANNKVEVPPPPPPVDVAAEAVRMTSLY